MKDIQLNEYSYYKTGGSCDALYTPGSVEELSNLLASLSNESIPYFLLGAGSNSLIMDEHWPGAVIVFSGMRSVTTDQTTLSVMAGLENTRFAEICRDNSLAGASWMFWLPGQIGSTVRMNARCYGGEISQIVSSITAVSPQGQIKRYQGNEVFAGYKNTIFMTNGEVVAEVCFDLEKGNPADLQQHMDFCRNDREAKHQFLHPSCGCVFKNNYDVGIPSGVLLDRAGVREFNRDRVEISPYHANFVFNKGATAREILEVILQMREKTYAAFGVWLELELELLGIVPEDLKRRVEEKKPPRYNRSKLAAMRAEFESR